MRSFREFLEAAATVSQPRQGSLRLDTLQFPDLHRIESDDRPGGFGSFSALQQHRIQQYRLSPNNPHRELWAERDVLMVLQNLAQQAASASNMKLSGGDEDTNKYGYPSARWVDQARTKIELNEKDIQSGTYPRMTTTHFEWAEQNGILKRISGGDFFELDINAIKERSSKLLEKLKKISTKENRSIYKAQQIDNLLAKGKNLLSLTVSGVDVPMFGQTKS